MPKMWLPGEDRKSKSLNSSHTEIYTLSLHDALPICPRHARVEVVSLEFAVLPVQEVVAIRRNAEDVAAGRRSEEQKSELQSHRDLHSFPTRRSSDLSATRPSRGCKPGICCPSSTGSSCHQAKCRRCGCRS